VGSGREKGKEGRERRGKKGNINNKNILSCSIWHIILKSLGNTRLAMPQFFMHNLSTEDLKKRIES
jgi:hypothetical protein